MKWLPQVRKWSGEKSSSRSGRNPRISLWVRENWSVWKKSGKSEILRVQLLILLCWDPSVFFYFLTLKILCTFYRRESCIIRILFMKLNEKLMLDFKENQSFWTLCKGIINSCTLHMTWWKHRWISEGNGVSWGLNLLSELIITVKRLLSGPPIKRTPFIKRTLNRVPKLTSFISLYNEPWLSGHLYQADADTKTDCIWLISIDKNLY